MHCLQYVELGGVLRHNRRAPRLRGYLAMPTGREVRRKERLCPDTHRGRPLRGTLTHD